tara:strand:+ start:1736 stop:2275 length:540 start_codon:yes stop_codon:yes gene_type:complete
MIRYCLTHYLGTQQVLVLDALYQGDREVIVDGYGKSVLESEFVDLPDLISRGFIELIDDSKPATLMNLDITNVTRAMFGEDVSSDYFDEFVDTYPRFLWIDGKRVAALNADMDELREKYEKLTSKKGMHTRIMKALEWAADNHEIHMGIKLWFSSRQWTAIEDIMNDTTGKALPGARLL